MIVLLEQANSIDVVCSINNKYSLKICATPVYACNMFMVYIIVHVHCTV